MNKKIYSKHYLFLILAAALTSFSSFAAAPQGGATPKVSLSDLGCGPNEIARVNSAEEWDCSETLIDAESGISNAQSTAERAVTAAAAAQSAADGAVADAAAAQSTADGAVADAAAAQSTADGAIADAASAHSTANRAEQASQDLSIRVIDLEQVIFPETLAPGGNFAGVDLGRHLFDDPIDEGGFAVGINFAGALASGFARFHKTDLRGGNFSGISGSANWMFQGCDLRGADFSGSTAGKISFLGCDVRGISVVAAVLGPQGLNISDNYTDSSGERHVGNSTSMDVRNTLIEGPLIGLNNGDSSDFSGSTWFSNGSFSTHFIASYCRDCKFNHVDFSEWNAYGGADEIRITYGQDTQWRGADLRNISIDGYDFRRADFRGASLVGATLHRMNLKGALFDGADISSLTWSGVICPDGSLSADNGNTCELHLVD